MDERAELLEPLIDHHAGREIVGIDLSPGMVRRARARAAGLPGVRVVVGDAVALDTKWTGECAAVLSVFGLQQLPDPAQALRVWAGALRPGGRLSVERDELLAYPIVHPDAATFFDAFTGSGPMRTLANARGEAFLDDLRRRFLQAAPQDQWRHQPQARLIVARR